ncbi:MAG: cyclic nucleotide-binding domain-containing protein [Verrucomicrobiales bacterium]|nr:cyclic nucleotide-binding domain-containing protein [Verrucomicrobiales bacterium]
MSAALTTAFILGLVSACSLPLGTLTSFLWRPSDRVIAFLMAFGGGALLAALTIDLAGPALAKGHFYWLAAGCIAGGILFVVLDQIVNQHGGFLRKVSTTIFHLHRKEAQRFRAVLSQLQRLDVLSDLPREDIMRLANAATSHPFKAGSTLFEEGDDSGCLYLVEEGEIDLLNPDEGMKPLTRIRKNSCFGHKAFFTSSPHAFVARAHTDGRVLVLSRTAFERIATESEPLQKSIAAFLESAESIDYLQKSHGLTEEEIENWKAEAIQAVHAGQSVPSAVSSAVGEPDLREVLEQISRIPIFHSLPEEDIEFLANCCFTKSHARGYTFFHPGEFADRLYILEAGQVVLLDPNKPERHPLRIDACDEFGALSFLTGAKHSVTAVASSDASVRVLLRRHFDALRERSPAFAAAVEEFIRQETLSEYLQKKHRFDTDKTARWVSRALGRRSHAKLLPSAAAMTREIQQHQGAPIAIWLGILLDGIPESLVIGASVGSHGTVSISLLAGLFLSNYPEALSSSVGMRQQGMPAGRILLMWTSLMVITGIGAALGVVFFAGAPPGPFALVQGVAAGAMLTMIAQTMLPEAYLKGGSITGFATLLGFLAAIFFKTLSGVPGAGH